MGDGSLWWRSSHTAPSICSDPPSSRPPSARGTTDSVAAALTALTAAENALVRTTTPPDTTVLDETIADMEKVNGSEYTTDSYKALTDAIAKAKSDKVKGDAGLNQQNIDAMKAAKEALVSTVELKAKVAEAGKVDSSKSPKLPFSSWCGTPGTSRSRRAPAASRAMSS